MTALDGFTVGVTAARRAEELGGLLTRRGADVLYGPAVRVAALADDTALRTATEGLIARPPDVTVITTGIGFRGWHDAAVTWGLDLLGALANTTLLCRGPKARGAVRGAGLTDHWSPASESTAEVLSYLLSGDGPAVVGRRVAVQLHGEPLSDVVEALRDAGAEVVPVPVYQWAPPLDLDPLDRLIAATVDGRVHALTFTSAPAAAGLLRRADELGHGAALLDLLRRDVLVACVGPVTAEPLATLDVPVVCPQRYRIADLVRIVVEELPLRST